MPEMKRVQSVMMQEVGHEGDTLYVTFSHGNTYKYSDVSAEEYEEMLASDSVGKWFARNIKGVKDFEKVEDGRE